MSSANGDTETATGLLDSDAHMRPFLDILKDSSSSNMNLSTVRSLALKVFADPQIFCGFDEFKSHSLPLLLPQGEDTSNGASSGPCRSLFNTLDLFSFGTLKDYTNHQEMDKEYYLPLNEPALAKLSQLSVLTCIQQACFNGETSISYDVVAESLGSAAASSAAAMQEDGASSSSSTTTNNREVEDVLVRCLYADVLKGKLCQKTRSFGWDGERLPVVVSRDVSPDSISGLLSALEGLGQRLEESGKDVAAAQEQVTQELEETSHYWISLQSQKKIHLNELNAKVGGFPSAGGGERLPSRHLFGRQGPGGPFSGPGGTSGAASASASQGGSINTRRSSKRSRGGMAGNFLADGAGFRM